MVCQFGAVLYAHENNVIIQNGLCFIYAKYILIDFGEM